MAGGALLRGPPGRPIPFRTHGALARGSGRPAAAAAQGGGGVPGPARRGAVEAECGCAAGGGPGGVPGRAASVQGTGEDGAVNRPTRDGKGLDLRTSPSAAAARDGYRLRLV